MFERLTADDCPVEISLLPGPPEQAPIDFQRLTGVLTSVVTDVGASQWVEQTVFLAGNDPNPAWHILMNYAPPRDESGSRDWRPLRMLVFHPLGGNLDQATSALAATLDAPIVRFEGTFTVEQFRAEVGAWLRDLLPPGPTTADAHSLPAQVEAFYLAWQLFSRDADLTPDDRRAGDAIALMANELVKSDDPPRSLLRAAFDWFAHKADVFTEEFAKSAGKVGGAGFMVGFGAVAGEQLPHLRQLIESVRALL
jgi:hypothetical protein